jgi:hypothetical protein
VTSEAEPDVTAVSAEVTSQPPDDAVEIAVSEDPKLAAVEAVGV